MSISSIKKILLAGTALVAVSAFALQAQAAQPVPAATDAIGTTFSTNETGTAGTNAPNASANPGGDALDISGGSSTPITVIDATLLGGNGGESTTNTNAAATGGTGGASGGAGVWINGATGPITFGATSSIKTITGGAGSNQALAATTAGDLSAVATGAGGIGILLNGAGIDTDNEATTGGVGSTGGASSASKGQFGGAGGDAVMVTTAGVTFTNNAALLGGAGGIGGIGVGAAGGNGGAGGNGFEATATNAGMDPGANITGGIGGNGGAGTTATAGNGGAGLLLSGTNAQVVMDVASVTVSGGNGGNGGATAGTAGNGGAGININNTGATIYVNTASDIVKGGTAGTHTGAGAVGTDGAGILIGGATGEDIINYGTIIGGNSGTTAAAINDTATTGTSSITNNAPTLGVGGVIGGVLAGDGIDIASGKSLVSLTNGGTIKTGSGNAIFLNGGASAITTLTNSGTISATTGIALNVTGTGVGIGALTNTGTITSANVTGPGGATIMLGSTGQGALSLGAGMITNTAASATAEAVEISAAPLGTISNAGTITSDGGAGVAVDMKAASAFSNSGTINGSVIDDAQAGTRSFTNTGTMGGSIVFTGVGADTITLTSGTLAGNISTVGSTGLTHSTGNIDGTVTLGTLGTGSTNSFTQTAGNVTGAVIMGGGGFLATYNNTLTLAGGQIQNTVTFNGFFNTDAVNVTGAYTTDGAISTTGIGTMNLATVGTGVLNVANAISGETLNVSVPTTGIINVNTGGSIVSTVGGTITTAGTGALNLVGGNVTVAGALTNNGAITVDTSQTLTVGSVSAGTGTTTFQVKGDGSTLVPGAAFNGTLASTGAVALTGTTIAVKVDPAGGILQNNSAYEVITASAQSGNVTVAGGAPTAITATPTLVATTGVDKFYAVTGNQTLSSAFGSDALVGTTSDIYLIAVQQSLTSLGSAITANDAALFNALSTASAADAGCVTLACTQLQTAIAAVNTAAGVSATAAHNALQALMPAGADGGSQSAALDVGADIQSIESGRITALRDGDTTSGVAAGASSHGTSMWLEGYGQHANQDMMGGVNGYGATTWGGAVGADLSVMFNKAIVGVAINYGQSVVDSKNANTTTTDLGNYGISLYGTYDLGNRMFVNGQAGYAYNTIDSTRHNVGGPGVNADGSTSSDQYSARLDTGRDYPVGGGLTLTPDVSAAYTYLNTAGYTETGAGGLDNTVASNSQNVLGLGIGGTAAWKVHCPEGGVLKPSLHVGYTYEAIDDKVQTSSTFAGDPAGTIFLNQGASPARSVFDVGAKVIYATAANWDFSANYDFQAKTDYTSNTGELRATAHF